jgi:hypothetical protein
MAVVEEICCLFVARDHGVCLCPGLWLKGVVCCTAISIANLAPYDMHSLPWNSVGLPVGTPAGACSRESQQVPVSQLLDSVATAWGLFHNLDSHSLQIFIAGMSVMRHRTALTWRYNSFSVIVGLLLKRSCRCTYFSAGSRMGNNY